MVTPPFHSKKGKKNGYTTKTRMIIFKPNLIVLVKWPFAFPIGITKCRRRRQVWKINNQIFSSLWKMDQTFFRLLWKLQWRRTILLCQRQTLILFPELKLLQFKNLSQDKTSFSLHLKYYLTWYDFFTLSWLMWCHFCNHILLHYLFHRL